MKSVEALKKYRDMSLKELKAEMNKVRIEQVKHLLTTRIGKNDKNSNVNYFRKELARIKTVLRQKEMDN